MIKSFFIVFTLCSLLVGCASNVSVDPKAPSESTAVMELLNEAEYNAANGQTDYAKSLLERALRIEPYNAHLWFALARINRQEGHYTNARNLAQRARAYSNEAQLQQSIDQFVAELTPFNAL